MPTAITPRTIYDGRDLTGSGYSWASADLTNSYFYGCNLSGVDLSTVTSFKGCEFYWCNMTGTKFTGLDLRNLNFGAGPTLQWCNLTAADFSGGKLTNVNLTGNKLDGIILSGTEITGTVGLVGITYVTSDVPTTGLVARYKADTLNLANNANVTTWADSVGTYTLTPGTHKPLYKTNIQNSLGAVLMNGSSDYFTAALALTQPFTYFLVAKATAIGNTYVVDGGALNEALVYIGTGGSDYIYAGGVLPATCTTGFA